jgi:hypothetical protein
MVPHIIVRFVGTNGGEEESVYVIGRKDAGKETAR